MKIRRSILLLTVLIVALMGLLLWYGKRKPPPDQITTNTESNTMPAGMTRNSSGAAPTATNAPVSKTPPGNQPSTPPSVSKGEQEIGVLSTYNDVPIDFYGRVEDQFGKGIADCAITFNVGVRNGLQSTVSRGEVKTDSNGSFSITGYRGEDLGLMPRKTGYALATTGTLFIYSRLQDHPFVSDQNNPTLIKMWKLQGAESLVKINGQYKLHHTNEPINFDLMTGKIVSTGGDIVLTVTRSPGPIARHNRPDWSVHVEAINGGVMDSGGQESVTYAAPESGYQNSMDFTFSTNAPYKWFEGFNQGLFVQSRGGQVYSMLGLTFSINRTPDDFMYIGLSGYANANGSRNLESCQP